MKAESPCVRAWIAGAVVLCRLLRSKGILSTRSYKRKIKSILLYPNSQIRILTRQRGLKCVRCSSFKRISICRS